MPRMQRPGPKDNGQTPIGSQGQASDSTLASGARHRCWHDLLSAGRQDLRDPVLIQDAVALWPRVRRAPRVSRPQRLKGPRVRLPREPTPCQRVRYLHTITAPQAHVPNLKHPRLYSPTGVAPACGACCSAAERTGAAAPPSPAARPRCISCWCVSRAAAARGAAPRMALLAARAPQAAAPWTGAPGPRAACPIACF